MVFAFRREPDLWFLIGSPTVWALHFLACYVLAAIHCEKAGGGVASLAPIRVWIFGLTAAALLFVFASGWKAWRHWGFGANQPPHDAATPEDRQRFLGYATLLISALSFVSIVFTALPVLIIMDCR
jgi:hypothetical protein